MSQLLKRGRLLATFRQFRSTQLRSDSLYTRLMALVPLFALAVVWTYVVHWNPNLGLDRHLDRAESLRRFLVGFGTLVVWNVWLAFLPHARRSPREDTLLEGYRLWSGSLVCGFAVMMLELLSHPLWHSFLLGASVLMVLSAVSHFLFGIFLLAAVPMSFSGRRQAVMIGTGPRSRSLRSILENRYPNLEVFGCLDDEYKGDNAVEDRYLGGVDKLAALLKEQPVEVVVIALPVRSQYDQIQRVIHVCETVGVESHYMHQVFETSRTRVYMHPEAPHEFSVLPSVAPHPMQPFKRVFDVTVALLLLLPVSPLMLAAAIAVRLSGPGPIFFVQQRYGRHRKLFPMFKFRSMTADAERSQAALESLNEASGPVFKLKRDPRVTPVGAFLRKTSIDELPQLFNVLRGEMSLVGPRPLPVRDVTRFDEPWLLRRFSVRPGLTCIWQISGRSGVSFERWMEQDLEYIDHWSLLLDLKILVRTVPAVLAGSGAM